MGQLTKNNVLNCIVNIAIITNVTTSVVILDNINTSSSSLLKALTGNPNFESEFSLKYIMIST